MIILSDCLTETADEGCIKVASSLVKRLKQHAPEITVISYERKPLYSDIHLKLNKFFLNIELLGAVRKKCGKVLYIPFASNTLASVVRICILSWFSGGKVEVLFALRHPMKMPAKIVLGLSKAELIVLSSDSERFYTQETRNKVVYLKTGVDTKKFLPITAEKKEKLRKKYNVSPNKKVLLHVGHLKRGRNVECLLKIEERYHIFLAISSVTKTEIDMELRKQLERKENITIIDTYLENVEELYQMADIYLFPVLQKENCIDAPLSVLEAASCNVPIITTAYGELENFSDEPGFCFISDFSRRNLNQKADEMAECRECHNREAVLKYDWEYAVRKILDLS